MEKDTNYAGHDIKRYTGVKSALQCQAKCAGTSGCK